MINPLQGFDLLSRSFSVVTEKLDCATAVPEQSGVARGKHRCGMDASGFPLGGLQLSHSK